MAKEFINRGTSVFQTSPHLKIPVKVKKIIKDKGFYLQEWISENDLKNSLKKDFTKDFLKYEFILIIFFILFGIFSLILDLNTSVVFFILTVSIIIFLSSFIIYFYNKATKKMINMKKNHFLLITRDYVGINGKIEKHKDIDYSFVSDINMISGLFEEPLFGKSKLNSTNEKLKDKLYDRLLLAILIFAGIYLNITNIDYVTQKESFLHIIFPLMYLILIIIIFLLYFCGILLT